MEPRLYGMGLLPMPADRVGLFPTYAPSDEDLLSDADLKKCFEDRKPARQVFDPARFVLNQRQTNSCCPHALVGGAMRSIFRRTGDVTPLSPLAAYSLLNGNRDQGAVLADAMQLVMTKGLVPLDSVPPGLLYQNQYPRGYYDQGQRFLGNCFEARSERRVATALARGLIVCVAIQVEDPFANFRGAGTDDVAPAAGGPGNHAVLVQDARWRSGQNRLEYDLGNSWGLEWGWQGHAWTYWSGHYAQTNQNHCFYVFESTGDDPKDPTLPPAVAA